MLAELSLSVNGEIWFALKSRWANGGTTKSTGRFPPTSCPAPLLKVVYTPSSLGKIETGDVVLAHADLGDWVFQATGVGEMPGVMQEHRTVATVGTTTSTMFPFRLVTRGLSCACCGIHKFATQCISE